MSDAPKTIDEATARIAAVEDERDVVAAELKKQLSNRQGQHRRLRRRLSTKVNGVLLARLRKEITDETMMTGAIKAIEAVVALIDGDAFDDED